MKKIIEHRIVPHINTKEAEIVSAHYDETKDWRMDHKGYFLIKLDRRRKIIKAAHCKKIGVFDIIIEGKKPQDIYFEAQKRGLVSRIDHAAYLGKELEKAYIALKLKKTYVQDEELKV
jgi:tetrahydromethanopterin S-methyltransferase subunit A